MGIRRGRMPWYTESDRTSYVGTYRTVEELLQEAREARACGWQLVSVFRAPVGLVEATFVRIGGAC
jgi:hypothetical protein